MRRLVVLLLVVAAIAATLWATRERLGEIAFSRALEASCMSSCAARVHPCPILRALAPARW